MTPEPADAGAVQHRQAWMDRVRGAAMVLVMIYHSSWILESNGVLVPWGVVAMNSAIAPMRMPTLMLISGLLLPNSLAKSPGRYLGGKLRRIAYPFVVWSLIYAAVVGGRPPVLSTSFWAPNTYLWYIQFLFVYYLAALAGRSLLSSRFRLVSTIATIGPLVFLALSRNGDGGRIWFLFSFFALGAAMARSPSILSRVTSSRAWWFAVVPATALSVLTIRAGRFEYSPYEAPLAVFAAIFVIKVAHCGGRRFWRPLESLGRNSIIYYLSHYTTMSFVFLLVVGRGLGFYPEMLLMFVAALVVGIGLCATRNLLLVQCLFAFPAPQLRYSIRAVAAAGRSAYSRWSVVAVLHDDCVEAKVEPRA